MSGAKHPLQSLLESRQVAVDGALSALAQASRRREEAEARTKDARKLLQAHDERVGHERTSGRHVRTVEVFAVEELQQADAWEHAMAQRRGDLEAEAQRLQVFETECRSEEDAARHRLLSAEADKLAASRQWQRVLESRRRVTEQKHEEGAEDALRSKLP
jgi:hypothetical protein